MIKLIIFPGYYIPHIGGLETHVDEFTKYLSKYKNYKITIFAPKIPKYAKEKEIRWDKVNIIRYPAFELISNYPIPKFWSVKFWKTWKNIKKEKFDIVMTRTRFFSNTFLGYILAKWKLDKTKLIHVEHGSSFIQLDSKIKNFLAKYYDLIIGKLIFKKADKIIVISKAVKKFVKKFVKNKKTHLIYRGIDFKYIDKITPNKEINEKYKNKIKLLFAGRLYKWKGVENSISAIKNLPENISKKIVFLIIGYGEDEKRLKKLANKELNKTIFFLGKKKFKETISIMKSCDYYLHSSYPGGGLSNSLLQAIYCGCTPIATEHEGANEIIKNTSSIKKYGDHIKNILKSNKKYKINLKKFSWKNTIKKYKVILECVV